MNPYANPTTCSEARPSLLYGRSLLPVKRLRVLCCEDSSEWVHSHYDQTFPLSAWPSSPPSYDNEQQHTLPREQRPRFLVGLIPNIEGLSLSDHQMMDIDTGKRMFKRVHPSLVTLTENGTKGRSLKDWLIIAGSLSRLKVSRLRVKKSIGRVELCTILKESIPVRRPHAPALMDNGRQVFSHLERIFHVNGLSLVRSL